MTASPQSPIFQTPPGASERPGFAGPVSLAVLVIALLLGLLHLVVVLSHPHHAATTFVAPQTASVEPADHELRDLEGRYGKPEIADKLNDLKANTPVGASIRSIGLMPMPQMTATVVAGAHGRARTYTDASPEGFPRAATHRLLASGELTLNDVNINAPVRMLGTIITGTDREADGWSSLELTRGRSGAAHWTAVWLGDKPAKFRADVDGGNVRLVSGTWR